MENLIVKDPVQVVLTVILAIFLASAVLEFRQARTWPRRVWTIPLVYCGVLALASLVACAALFFLTSPSSALVLSRKLLAELAPGILLTFVFLTALLSLKGDPLPCLSRVFNRRAVADRAADRLQPRVSQLRALLEGAVYTAIIFGFSMLWLFVAAAFFHARIAPERLEALRPDARQTAGALMLNIFALIILAPFMEEVIFRGFIQGKLAIICRHPLLRRMARTDLVVPIAATSALWAIGHFGILQPNWVKWVQIFGIGVVIGVARMRLGLEACVILHLIFNLAGGFYAPTELVAPESGHPHWQTRPAAFVRIAAASSASFSVEVLPKETRTVAAHAAASDPMASRTWEGSSALPY